MAALDNLLRAVLQYRLEDLVLIPGAKPRARIDGVERDVGQQALDARRIELLVREVAPPGLTIVEGLAASFLHTVDGRALSCEARGGLGAWQVRIAPAPPAATPPGVAAAERPVTSVVELLGQMLTRQGSDLHLSSDHRPRIRVHGDLEEISGVAAVPSTVLADLLEAITPEKSRQQFATTNEADFAFELPEKGRFRVNLFRDHRGVGAVLRTVPNRIPTCEELGLPDAIRALAQLSKGLVLVTGPTGSGKSTTLAAIVDLINRTRSDHIITIEDPIEFVHASKRCLVNQREVGVSTESFRTALRAALREDPDVVLVGEMRDLETASIAIETAETGHLVFGTLHTTTAISTIERLVDQFPGDRQGQVRMMLADSLKAVIAQTLLKKVGGGRVAAYEILITTPAVSNLIREAKTFQIASAMQTGRSQGMVRQLESIWELVEKGVVEPREAYLKAIDKEALLQKLRAANHNTQFLDELRARA